MCISVSLILNERLEYEPSENAYTVILAVRTVHYLMRTVRIAKNNYLHHCYLHNKDMLDIRMKKFCCEKIIFDEIAAL